MPVPEVEPPHFPEGFFDRGATLRGDFRFLFSRALGLWTRALPRFLVWALPVGLAVAVAQVSVGWLLFRLGARWIGAASSSGLLLAAVLIPPLIGDFVVGLVGGSLLFGPLAVWAARAAQGRRTDPSEAFREGLRPLPSILVASGLVSLLVSVIGFLEMGLVRYAGIFLLSFLIPFVAVIVLAIVFGAIGVSLFSVILANEGGGAWRALGRSRLMTKGERLSLCGIDVIPGTVLLVLYSWSVLATSALQLVGIFVAMAVANSVLGMWLIANRVAMYEVNRPAEAANEGDVVIG